MVDRFKNFICRSYIAVIMFFLYAPILVLIVSSFNASRSRVIWGGFTLRWYVDVFSSRSIMEALYTTLAIAFLSSLPGVAVSPEQSGHARISCL